MSENIESTAISQTAIQGIEATENSPSQSQLEQNFDELDPQTALISSMDDLKNKSKKIYDEMVQSIARGIVNELKKSAERFKRANRGG